MSTFKITVIQNKCWRLVNKCINSSTIKNLIGRIDKNSLVNLIDSEMNIKETKLWYLAQKFVTDVVKATKDEQLKCFQIYAEERNEDSVLLSLSVLHGNNHTMMKAADDHDTE